jgi:hypothetical protein
MKIACKKETFLNTARQAASLGLTKAGTSVISMVGG